MEIRRYKSVDLRQISRLFYETVHAVNIKDKCVGDGSYRLEGMGRLVSETYYLRRYGKRFGRRFRRYR